MKRVTERTVIDTGAFQGDVGLRRVDELPEGAVRQPDSGEVVIAHSETGHHHVASGADAYFLHPTDPAIAYLVASGPVEVVHRRDFDQHAGYCLYAPEIQEKKGEVIWEIRRQKELTPAGWRVAVD